MPRRLPPALLAALLPTLLLAGCGGEPAGPAAGETSREPRSLLLLTLDTTRADHLEPYGAAAGATPALADLARGGIVFERASAVSPLTLPSHATLLTGLYPPQHGLRNNGSHHLPASVTTLAERFREHGLRTAAFVSAAVLERRYGLDQGFGVYDDDLGGGREARMVVERPAAATVDAALAWLAGLGAGERFFLWVHLFDPHASYAPPAPWSERFAGRPYAGEIAYMDAEIGRLLADPRLDPAAGTAVAAIADHGESLGEHGEETHGLLAYEATLKIPWILRLPGDPQGRRAARPASQIDLVPTLLDLFGLEPEPPSALPGISLLAEGEGDDRPLYAESLLPYFAYGWSQLKVLRRGDLKVVEAPEASPPAPELYDLSRDPEERENLFERRAEGRELARHLARLADEMGQTEATLPVDDATAERLRSLGYVAAAGGEGTERPGGRPDPRAVIDLHHLLQQAEDLIAAGDLATAERLLREIRARDPHNLKLLDDLAQVLVAADRRDEARKVLEEALGLAPGHPAFTLRLAEMEGREERHRRARALAALGRWQEAEALWRELHREEPDAAACANLAALALERRDWPAAREWAERAAALAPGHAAAWNSLGFALDELGRPREAAAAYERALAADPGYWQAAHNLGLLRLRGNDFAAAAAAFEEALRRRPGHADSHFQLTLLYAGPLGDPRRALDHLDACLESAPEHPRAAQLRELRGRLQAALGS